MGSTVFFTQVGQNEKQESINQKVLALFSAADLGSFINKNDLIGIKMHFGEEGNNTHIPPHCVSPIVEEIRKKSGMPFLTDTCVLYRSQRDNSVNHLLLAHQHGFSIDRIGAPVIIADGLIGNAESMMDIPGKIFKQVAVARTAVEANGLVVLSHVTGHIATGFGGTIKNLGMGFSSRKGKLKQHSVTKPSISSKKCTGCALCVQWCPEDAISMKGEKAVIDSTRCIGCGECLTVCRFGAVGHGWGRSNDELQKRIAEHALGVTVAQPGRISYMNFLLSITKDCDCWNEPQKPIIPDIGILASKDPVAIDAASLDLIHQETDQELKEMSYPDVNPWVQIHYGAEIGLGSETYELVHI